MGNKVTFDDIIKIFTEEERKKSKIEMLILNYGELKQRLDNFDQQSWYFRMAYDNKIKELRFMRKRFDAIREEINVFDKDELINELEEEKKKLDEAIKQKGGSRLMYYAKLSMIKGAINEMDEYLEFKAKTDYLEDIDFYVENPEELKKLLE